MNENRQLPVSLVSGGPSLFAGSPALMAAYRCGRRIDLSDADGEPCRLRDCPPCPGAVVPFVVSEGESDVESFPGDVIYDLDSERDLRWQDDVTRFLVHCAGEVRRGDAEHEESVVVCRPGVEVALDLGSDAFMPVVDADCNAVDHGYVPDEKLAGVLACDQSGRIGLLDVWADERGPHEAVVGPRPYKRRPEQVIVLDDALWERNVAWMGDLLGQEDPGFLCLHFVSDRSDDQIPPLRGAAGAKKPVEHAHGTSSAARVPAGGNGFHDSLRGLLFWLGVLAMCLGVYAGLGFLLYFLVGLAGVWHPSYLLCVVVGGLFAVVTTCAFLGHELIVAPEMADLDRGAE